jgi:hypothetical protein
MKFTKKVQTMDGKVIGWIFTLNRALPVHAIRTLALILGLKLEPAHNGCYYDLDENILIEDGRTSIACRDSCVNKIEAWLKLCEP